MQIRVLLLIVLFLVISLTSVSAVTHEKADNQGEFRYCSPNYKYNVYINSDGGFILTYGYKQIGSIKIVDINNENRILANNIDFKNNKTQIGYYADIDFNRKQLNLSNIKKIEVNFVKQPDIKISKISKNKKDYLITIKNNGDLIAKKNYLEMYLQKNNKYKLITKLKLPSISSKKSKIIKIKIMDNYNKSLKLFQIYCKDKITERYENNNFKIYK